MPLYPPASSGGGVATEDEGTPLGTTSSLNFTGSGVTASGINPTVVNVSGGAGGGSTYTPITVDLGTNKSSGFFDITGLSGLTVNTRVLVFQTAGIIASKGNSRDEFEDTAIIATGYVLSTTSIRVYWYTRNNDVVVGDYEFAYSVSA